MRGARAQLWVGNSTASENPIGWEFQGHAIVMAAITDLVTIKGMGSTPGDRMLFGGCSAGAIGAMNNLDYVTELVGGLAPDLPVKGFIDAAALVDIYPTDNGWSWGPNMTSLQTMQQEMVAIVDPVVPPDCDYSGDDLWKCIWPSYRMPLVQTPFFVTWAQFDAFQLGGLMDNYVPSTPAQFAFAAGYQDAVLSAIGSLPAGTGVFSTTCFVHCLTGAFARYWGFSEAPSIARRLCLSLPFACALGA